MKRRVRFSSLAPLYLLGAWLLTGAEAQTSLFVAGDSTAAEGNPNAVGWGRELPKYFDGSKISIVNAARGGRSSRTFITEGHWSDLIAKVKPHDYVMIQFGHNDGGEINGERIARGSLPGLGEETQEIENRLTKQHETVHTFGYYMRKMIGDTKEKGATPIVLSLTVRCIWKDGRVERGSGEYGAWSRELAASENVAFYDLTNIVADRYEQMGEEAVKAMFPKDHTHTNAQGADLNAQYVVAGIKAWRENAILKTLSSQGRAIETAPAKFVVFPHLTRPAASDHDAFLRWLNLPDLADPALPSLFLIGDSTVRNGRSDGVDGLGQWGWGDPLVAYFDPTKINIVNRAVGGTGARTFLEAGYWDKIIEMLKPGDFVLMQFGHNDNGPRGSLPGTDETTEMREGKKIHSFGWYLRKYVADTRAKGATPILCTLVPRNIWTSGRIDLPQGSHADWTRSVAREQNVPLLELNEAIGRRYDQLGEAKVTSLFADKKVHTSREGAELNASIVASLLREMPGKPVSRYLLSTPAAVW